MKIRSDFVTNSSSTSYICEICSHAEGGWDLSLSECSDLVMCEKEHIFCSEHIVNKDYKTVEDENWGNALIPETHCPLCQLDCISEMDAMSYFEKLTGLNHRRLAEEIKHGFGTYDNFQKYLRGTHEAQE